jgi:thiol-disulfide isomerase/thioredoxin
MRILTTLLLSLFTLFSWAQDGFEIQVSIDGYTEAQLYLAYYLGDKQYIQDTVDRADDGTYTFSGEEALPGGIYLVVMAPDNNFFQLLVDEKNQRFKVATKIGEQQLAATKFVNSPDNTRFYKYLQFLADQRTKGNELQEKIEATTNESKKEALQKELESLGDEVLAYQKKLIAEHPNSMPAAIIKANIPADIPDFPGVAEADLNESKWRWMQKHYFDNINLGDSRMLRTPFLFQQVDHYIQKLQVQHPDTLSKAIDYVLEQMKPAEDVFKYYLIHFLNSYAGSKFVGMDAVYVHLVDNYYAKNLAPWTDEEQLEKIIENADRLRPLLIGRTAPELIMERQDGSKIALSEVESPYTVLYFWRYDCGHCKKSTPVMKEFYDNFKDRGVTIFAACAKLRDEIPECWDYIDENEIGEWIHVVDPYNRSRYMQIYDLKSTPQIYILDADKKIISKRLGAEQLEEFFNRILDGEGKTEGTK